MDTTRFKRRRSAASVLPPGPWTTHRTRHTVLVLDARGELVRTVDTRLPLDDQERSTDAFALLPGLLTPFAPPSARRLEIIGKVGPAFFGGVR